MAFADEQAREHGARLLYYYRRPRDPRDDHPAAARFPHFVGVKIGTTEDRRPALCRGAGRGQDRHLGIGDRSTAAAEMGAKGHTSGINIVVARASDAINNAQRARDMKWRGNSKKSFRPWRISASCRNAPTIIPR